MRSLLIFSLCLLGFAASAGEMYKWTDEKGQVHYSDKPPQKGTEYERRDVREEADTETERARLAKQPLECQLAVKNLKTFEDNPVVLMDTDGDGQVETLEGASHAAAMQRAKDQVSQLCNKN